MTDEQFKTLCEKIDNVADVVVLSCAATDIILLFILIAIYTR